MDSQSTGTVRKRWFVIDVLLSSQLAEAACEVHEVCCKGISVVLERGNSDMPLVENTGV